MAKTNLPAILKGADEVHIRDAKGSSLVYFIKDKKAYYADGRQVEADKLFVCPYCTNSPPAFSTKEIDIVKHVIEEHPEHAKKQADSKEKTTKKKTGK